MRTKKRRATNPIFSEFCKNTEKTQAKQWYDTKRKPQGFPQWLAKRMLCYCVWLK